jgi:myo-inositol-1(or 4)-monophosphatase
MNWQQTLEAAIGIAREAGDYLRRHYGGARDISRKTSTIDLVTEVDRAAEALISARLTAAFPDHRLVREEEGDTGGDSPLVWYVDPLDGTTNYAHGFPVFCVSMALYEAGKPRVGVVYDPMRRECFCGIAGGGAWLENEEGRHRLAVSRTDRLPAALLATGFPYDRHTNPDNNLAQFGAFLARAQGVRRAGAAALDLAYVAAGRLDGYWEFGLSTWDAAAGVLLVIEAGGLLTAPDGGPFSLQAPVDLVAANRQLQAQMVSVLTELPRRGQFTAANAT